MDFFFEYIYYRVTKAYFKWDGRVGITAITAISMIQCVMMFNIYILTLRIVNGTHVRQMPIYEKWGIALVFSIIYWYNHRKHHKNYNKYKLHWKNESKSLRVLKGFLVFLALLFPWLLTIIIAVIYR